ncbi:NAD(P)-binding protein [Patellaria atrata CBS 101060]|uniref:NAD(P)-binding protein n=1 Tax=Patellaria atrata CBS 101060 TaxID=1346257 RepID=A0A9P4SB59_9PEZI|nr:NAD(P)-binding protein [Patellaria atrata CBS 101060]
MPPFEKLTARTVIVTGEANGIGAQTIRTFHEQGTNVVIAHLPATREAAETLIDSLSDRSRFMFVLTDILDWENMKALFETTIVRFNQVDIVVANAGVMETQEFFNFETDEDGELKEPNETYKVIDINLKGTMNTLRLALHYMRSSSIILISPTSGYFGSTGVVCYVASKHGVVGLLRASQRAAEAFGVRLNPVASFFTPTHITGSYAERWKAKGLHANTVKNVTEEIVKTARDISVRGQCYLVAGQQTREIESARTKLTLEWLGEEMANLLIQGGKFFDELGGYPLPKPRVDQQ